MNKKVLFLILSFTLLMFGNANAMVSEVTVSNDSIYIYTQPDQMASFPGGTQALFSFLNTNLCYPKAAYAKRIQGKVLVEFVVRKDGSITDVKPVKSVHPELDKEAVRVVKSMPKWIPGKDKGKNVNVHFVLPITFRLK
jgi:protein TonB